MEVPSEQLPTFTFSKFRSGDSIPRDMAGGHGLFSASRGRGGGGHLIRFPNGIT